MEQPAIFRYENAQAFPPYGVLMQYAEFFNVSLDYIFGRTDNPKGQLYDYQPKALAENNNMQDFVEMCFDTKSPANAMLREAVMKILTEQKGAKQ